MAYVCLYLSYFETLEPFTDAERGRIMMAMMNYVATGEIPTFEGNERFIWPTIQAQIERDIKEYERRCEKNRRNGEKGGRPKKPMVIEETQKTERFLEETKKAKENEKENENENKKEKENNNITKAQIDSFFDSVWNLYPVKKGKGQVSNTKRKVLYNIGFDEIERAVERYLAELKKDADWRKPQNGSTFFNSGYVDYLDKNFAADQQTAAEPELTDEEIIMGW